MPPTVLHETVWPGRHWQPSGRTCPPDEHAPSWPLTHGRAPLQAPTVQGWAEVHSQNCGPLQADHVEDSLVIVQVRVPGQLLAG